MKIKNDRVVRVKWVWRKMGHFVVPSNDQTKNNIKKAKNGMLFGPMIR